MAQKRADYRKYRGNSLFLMRCFYYPCHSTCNNYTKAIYVWGERSCAKKSSNRDLF